MSGNDFRKISPEEWKRMDYRKQWDHVLPDYKYGSNSTLDFEHLTEWPPSVNKREQAAVRTNEWIVNNLQVLTALDPDEEASDDNYCYDNDDDESDFVEDYAKGNTNSNNNSSNNNNDLIDRCTKFVNALQYCPFDLGFHSYGRVLHSDQRCHCPCSWMMRLWREQFYIEENSCDGFMDKTNSCCKKRNKFIPIGLVVHLETLSKTELYHKLVYEYLKNLYENYYGNNLHHKGLYRLNTEDHKRALAAERELEYVEKQQKIQEAFEKGSVYRKDYTEKLKKLYEQQKLVMKELGIDEKLLAVTKKDVIADDDMEEYQRSYNFVKKVWFDTLNGQIHVENDDRITIVINIGQQFKLSNFFEEQYNDPNSFIFTDLDETNWGKFMIPLDVKYKSERLEQYNKKRRRNKEEHEAIDKGGPSKQFFSDVWKQIGDLSITVDLPGIDGEKKKIPLFEADDKFLVPVNDDFLYSKFSNNRDALIKAQMYYKAVGRLWAYCLGPNISDNEDPDDTKNQVAKNQVVIASHVMPNFYKNYFLRRKNAHKASYKLPDLVQHTFEVIPCNGSQEEIGDDNKIKGKEMLKKIKDFIEFRYDNSDENTEDMSVEARFRKAVDNHFLVERNIAVQSLKEGLTLGGKIDPTIPLAPLPLEGVDKLVFAKVCVTAADIIHCIKPVYSKRDTDECREYQTKFLSIWEDGTKEGILVDLLKKKETDGNHEFIKNFLLYATGCHYIPQTDFVINIEFNKKETKADNLPKAHTCTNDLVFPSRAYEANIETLDEKLTLAFKLMPDNLFGMG